MIRPTGVSAKTGGDSATPWDVSAESSLTFLDPTWGQPPDSSPQSWHGPAILIEGVRQIQSRFCLVGSSSRNSLTAFILAFLAESLTSARLQPCWATYFAIWLNHCLAEATAQPILLCCHLLTRPKQGGPQDTGDCCHIQRLPPRVVRYSFLPLATCPRSQNE